MKEDIFIQTGAVKKGHFLLASGMHSGNYFQAQALLQYPDKAEKAAKKLAGMWKAEKIDVVVSLAVGGIVLGQEIARQLKVRHIFLERKDGKFTLKRGFELKENEKVLLVEDVITTGGSVREGLEVLKQRNVQITGITSLVLRGKNDLKYPLKYLMKIDWPVYNPEECPFCRKGEPLKAPGTKQSSKS